MRMSKTPKLCLIKKKIKFWGYKSTPINHNSLSTSVATENLQIVLIESINLLIVA